MNNFFVYLLVMAGVTYLVRMIPLVLVKNKIKNRFVKSFLYYVPFAVLTVMTVPAIFTATDYVVSAFVGFTVAVILAYFEKGLLEVAIFACASVFVTEAIITYIIPLF